MNVNLKEAEGVLAAKANEIAAMSAKISTWGCSGCANCSGIVGG